MDADLVLIGKKMRMVRTKLGLSKSQVSGELDATYGANIEFIKENFKNEKMHSFSESTIHRREEGKGKIIDYKFLIVLYSRAFEEELKNNLSENDYLNSSVTQEDFEKKLKKILLKPSEPSEQFQQKVKVKVLRTEQDQATMTLNDATGESTSFSIDSEEIADTIRQSLPENIRSTLGRHKKYTVVIALSFIVGCIVIYKYYLFNTINVHIDVAGMDLKAIRFVPNDFIMGLKKPYPDTFRKIRIDSDFHDLRLNGVSVKEGQEINYNDISQGHLIWGDSKYGFYERKTVSVKTDDEIKKMSNFTTSTTSSDGTMRRFMYFKYKILVHNEWSNPATIVLHLSNGVS